MPAQARAIKLPVVASCLRNGRILFNASGPVTEILASSAITLPIAVNLFELLMI